VVEALACKADLSGFESHRYLHKIPHSRKFGRRNFPTLPSLLKRDLPKIQQMPIFSTRYQREVRLIQSLKSGQHFATSSCEYEHVRRCNDETAIHSSVVPHSASSPSVDYVPSDSICAVADALGILRLTYRFGVRASLSRRLSLCE
jgi:hypothetical protein